MKRKILILAAFSILLNTYPSYALTKAKEFTLQNGMKIIFMEIHNLPIIKVNVGLRGGTFWEKGESVGSAAITMQLMDQGTKTRSALQIAKSLDFVGASLSASAGKDFSTITLSTLSKDIDLGLDILSDVMLHPSFPQKEVERLKKETISMIEKKKEDPSSVASEIFSRTVYSLPNYKRPLEGYTQSVEKIKRNDVIAYYKKAFRPNLTTIVVVGDIKEDVLREKVQKLFGGWQGSDVHMPELFKENDYTPKNIKIEKDLTQTTMFIGHPGIKRENPDYYAVYVMNYIMGGGGFSSRMMQNIRDNHGLVYTIYSYFSSKYYGGAFFIFAQTKNKTKEKALKLIKEEINEMKNNGVSEPEIRDAKSYIIGSFPLKLDTMSKIASYLTYIEQYHLGLDYFETFPKRVKKVTVEDIKRVAKKYLKPENMSTVLVGGKE